ncbi:MAG: type II toxin-antitoxin system CcdA family antitoxin [Alphaproteobacteria bacterium]|nr:type II toxin-antitoxin system CcdA family antitoxin [Alphaproteobacteria bacterium]
MSSTAPARKRATNVSLSPLLVAEAKALGVNVSQACERGLEEDVRKARAAAWLEANAPALEAWNRYVEEHGLPLARYRQF